MPNRRPDAPAFVVATMIVTTVLVTAVVPGAAVVVGAPLSSAATAAGSLPARPSTVTVTATACAPGWKGRTAGRVVFRIEDRTGRRGTIDLFNPFRGVTVAHAALRPHGSVALPVRLKAGRYRWSCRLKGAAVTTSAQGTVRTAPASGPAGPTVRIPVTSAQMAGPVTAYRAYVTEKLTVLSDQVQALGSAIAGGQLAPARAAWLTAHLTWHQVGGAYDAFGHLGTAIDGTAAGLQAGVASPRFTGFHKVELDLWGTDHLASAGRDTTVLLASVHDLATQFPQDPIAVTELPLRTHEILEDALRDELTGDDDYGSGTDLASVTADVDGTRALLSLVAPLVARRAPDLVARATAHMIRLDAALAATEVGGRWVAVSQVPLTERQQVDGAIGAVLEILAFVPAVLPVVGSTT